MSIADSTLLNMSVAEKLRLIGDLWDSIAGDPGQILLSAEQVEELERRAEEYRRNPEIGRSWEEVKAKILEGSRESATSPSVPLVLQAFIQLTPDEQREAAAIILKTVVDRDDPPLDDELLARIADESFQEYDAREAARDEG